MIRVGIFGYGNLGRGVELALRQNPDLELCAIFTRRDPAQVKPITGVPVHPAENVLEWKDALDVLILCGGSAKDLPRQSPELAKHFTIVDSFDTHAHIPEHFSACNASAAAGGNVAILSAGWDPGLFSLMRLYGQCILPQGADYTFWGRGISQGHSDAIRRIPGVQDAKQYTVPVENTLERVRSGQMPRLTAREKHLRQCFVVPAPGADLDAIRQAIVTMPDYFADYNTTVEFITQQELNENHRGLPHGGLVLRTGKTGANEETQQTMEFRLELVSNPEFTGSILVCCARAAWALHMRGETGAKTLFDIPPALLSPCTPEELRRTLL